MRELRAIRVYIPLTDDVWWFYGNVGNDFMDWVEELDIDILTTWYYTDGTVEGAFA